ncbi:hypothetical protein JZ785_18485 [Alicyclobacillus curvatus]|nr:hypothetical protein JZ785_18485 [Alicyclobacillus curvatus]
MKDYGTSELWSDIEYWVSENYLAKVVALIHPRETSGRVYAAAASGSACIRQSIAYEEAAKASQTSVQPLLLYYALLNWIKAFLHIVDVTYPSATTVLQHGVSVRRTKKNSYQLATEMVYIYKQGVLPSAAEMVGLKLPQRINLGDILGLIPELHTLVTQFYPKYQHLFPVKFWPAREPVQGLGQEAGRGAVQKPGREAVRESGQEPGREQVQKQGQEAGLQSASESGLGSSGRSVTQGNSFLVPRSVASSNGQTVAEWVEDLQRSAPTGLWARAEDGGQTGGARKPGHGTGDADESTGDRQGDRQGDGQGDRRSHEIWTAKSFMEAPSGYLRLPEVFIQHPWMMSNPSMVDPLKSNGQLLAARQPYPSWVNHFIMLYCLSALVRYNPLEWSDIVRWHNEQDALIVDAYLKHSAPTIRESLRDLLDDMVAQLRSTEDECGEGQ